MLFTASNVPVALVPNGKLQYSMEKRDAWKISYDHLLSQGCFL